jgi:hypothetical protein
MSEWKNEDDIKAELRVLTKDLKHLREELRDMVTPPKQRSSRALWHRQSGPPSPPAIAVPPEAAADKPRKRKPRKRR